MLEIVFIIRGILNSWARPSTKTTKIGSPRIKSISQYSKTNQQVLITHRLASSTVSFSLTSSGVVSGGLTVLRYRMAGLVSPWYRCDRMMRQCCHGPTSVVTIGSSITAIDS